MSAAEDPQSRLVRQATIARPLSDAMRSRLDETLARIPSGRTGAASIAVTKDQNGGGIEAELGVRKTITPSLDFVGSGFAGKLWGGGWSAGARAAILFGRG